MTAALAHLGRLTRRISITEPVARWWETLPRPARAAVVVAAALVALIVPRSLSPYWQSVLFFPVGLYVLLALGLNVVVGQAGLLDLGYVAFYAVGAYTTAKLSIAVSAGGAALDAWVVLPIAVVAAMAAGVVLGAPTLRLRGDYLAIVTLGFGEIVRIVAQNTPSLGAAAGITGIPHPESVPGLEFGTKPLAYYYLTLAAVTLAIVMLVRLRRSRVGRAWSAVREDEDAAEATGVPTFKMKLWSFAIGASTGGLAGWIYASKVSYINPDNFPLFLSIVILAAVVLGGMGSIPGVLAGAFAIAFLPEYLRDAAAGEAVTRWLNAITGGDANNVTEYRVLLFGAALVAVMIFRPQGLLPSRQRAAELAEATPDKAMAVLPEAGGDATAPDEADVDADRTEEPVRIDRRPAASDEEEAAELAEVAELFGTDRHANEAVLQISHLTMEFGGVVALREVGLTVWPGQIFGIIGPNGAGKTTVFNCVTGFFRPTRGDVKLLGRSIMGLPAHRITEAGVARTFQNIRLFPNMTALENVLVGTDARHGTSVPGALVGSRRHRREERTGQEEAVQLLEFVGIGHRRHEAARNLPYGDQRRLEIARALATGPSVLLLDEPAAGMNPSEKRSLVGLIRQIRDTGLTVLLIEHDMGLVMNVCDQVAVLDFGEKIAEGPPSEIRHNPRVIEAYLGVDVDAS